MKFACVELYTKSGKIWDGAGGKPNYLCNPKNEIDNSSFGCWTSAMQGEHVPLSWFKLRKIPSKIYHSQLAPRMSRFNYAGYSLFSRMANKAFEDFHNLEYLSKFDVVLVDIHEYSIQAMAKFIVSAKKMQKRPIFLGVFGVTFNIIREALKDPETFSYFKTFIDNCDVFLNWGNEAISEYLKFYTDTPVVNFPMFYPYEFTKRFFRPYQEKEKIIFISGHTQRTDHVLSLLIAKKIQAKYPDFFIETIGRPGQNLETLKGARYGVVPFLNWTNYLDHTGKTYMIIDMDNTWTSGRTVNDAAAVGTPCIGINSGNQGRLFPDLACLDVIDTKRAFSLGCRLIEDRQFYESMQSKATKKLEESSYENSVKSLKKLLKNLNLGDF